MTLATRFSGLAVLSILAACGSSTGGGVAIDPIVTETLAAAGAVAPATTDDFASNRDAATSDISGDGLHGYAATGDGRIMPIRIRVSEDASTAYVSLDGAPEVAYATGVDVQHSSGYGYWNGDNNYQAQLLYAGDKAYPFYLVGLGGSGVLHRGYTGLHTPVEGLPEGTVIYAGNFDLQSNDNFSPDYVYGDFDAEIDFANATITGNVTGAQYPGFSAYLEDEGTDFAATLSGAVAANQIAMSSMISEDGLTGDLLFLGGIFDNGTQIAGGAVGTFNDVTYGGRFQGEEVIPE